MPSEADPLIPQVSDGGIFLDPGSPSTFGTLCLGGSVENRPFAEWFHGWRDATSLPEYGGRVYPCTQCQPNRIVKPELGPADTEGFELVAEPAQLQWIWICVRRDPIDSPDTAHFGLRIEYGEQEMYDSQGASFTPTEVGAVFAIRARQAVPDRAIRLTIWRPEGEEDSEVHFLFTIAGSVGYVSPSGLPPWETDL